MGSCWLGGLSVWEPRAHCHSITWKSAPLQPSDPPPGFPSVLSSGPLNYLDIRPTLTVCCSWCENVLLLLPGSRGSAHWHPSAVTTPSLFH